MSTRMLVAAVAAVALVVGCATPDDKILRAVAAAQKCRKNDNRDDCKITVTVVDSGSSCALRMEVDQETIAFPRGAQNKFIFWELDDRTQSGKFRFTQDGIAIEKNASHEFDKADRFNNGQGFRWRNLNRVPGEYYYAVHVERKDDDSIFCDLDPKISNE